MNNEAAGRAGVPSWVVLLIAATALVVATAALTATLAGGPSAAFRGGMMGGNRGGMMGGAWSGTNPAFGSQPGDAGFVAGTAVSPRTIRVVAGPGYAFSPSSITVSRGETVTFQVTAMGPFVHEFMVGPAGAVAADTGGIPEVSGIGMMKTRSLTYTFDGDGPYAFACHATGHYEAGMRGTIVMVG